MLDCSQNTISIGKATPSSFAAASMEFVQVLPQVGKKGVLYLVNTGATREGYAIFQEFAWDEENEEWIAIGAFDSSIVPTGLVYERSFDATTGTWVVGVNQ